MCLSISPRGYLRNHTYDLFVHVAYVCGLVLLWHVDNRPHHLSAGRGDGSAQRGRSVIYDCLVRKCEVLLVVVTGTSLGNLLLTCCYYCLITLLFG